MSDIPRPPRKGQDPPAARHLRLVSDKPTAPRAKHRRPAPPFTAEQEARIRAALSTSRRTFGTWVALASAMGLDVAYVYHVKASRRLTGDFAIRLARALGKPLESLCRAPTAADVCPTCGAKRGAP